MSRVEVIENILDNAVVDVKHHNLFNTRTALQTACKHGDIKVVKLLLEHGADVCDIANGLVDAAATGDLGLVKLLLENGVDINHQDNPQENTPLLSAIKARKYKVARYLIVEGADVSYVDSNENNALLLLVSMKKKKWYHFGRD
jgi:ankyrin repeat protein